MGTYILAPNSKQHKNACSYQKMTCVLDLKSKSGVKDDFYYTDWKKKVLLDD